MSIVQDITIREAIEADIIRFQTELTTSSSASVTRCSSSIRRNGGAHQPAAEELYGDRAGLRGHAVEALFAFRPRRGPRACSPRSTREGELRDRDARSCRRTASRCRCCSRARSCATATGSADRHAPLGQGHARSSASLRPS